MTDDRDDIIILVDENGEEVEVEHIDTITMGDNEYVVLLPKDESVCDDDSCFECDDCEEEEVVILKVESSENGEDTFVAIEDEEEQEAVFEIFTKKIEDTEYDDFEE